MDSIQAEMKQAAKKACAKGSDEGVMLLEYEATVIALEIQKKYGGDEAELIERAIKIMDDARRAANPKRQAEIDATIEEAARYNDTASLRDSTDCLAMSLVGKFGGQPVDYMMRAYDVLKKARVAREKEQVKAQQ